MTTFHPKEIFQQAREAERLGKSKEAAAHYASLSAYLRRRGKADEALTLIRRGIALAPQSNRLYLQLALCAEAKGDLAGADAALAQFSQKAIEGSKVEHYRPLVETALKDHPRLRQLFFDAVLELDRTGGAAFLGQAQSLRQQGDEAGALKVLLDALQAGSEKDQVLDAIGECLRTQAKAESLIHLGRYRDGKISTENFLVLLRGATRDESMAGLASAGEGVSEKPLKDLIEELEKEIGDAVQDPADEIAPLLKEFRRRSQLILGADARARMDMALAYFEMGLVKEAADELAVVEESDPLYAEAQALLGEISLQSGNYLAALDAFQKSLRASHLTQEAEREARYKLVQVFYRLGDLRQAFAQASELEKLAPEYRDLRLLKNQIEEALEKG